MKISATSFLLGGLAWTLSEYLIQRFVGHGPRRQAPRGPLAQLSPAAWAYEFNREHLRHHATPGYFGSTSRKAITASLVLPSFVGVLTPLAGFHRATSFAVGFGLVYAAYEVIHRRVHTRPPRGPYGRWVRRHHLLHHHKTPRQNHGVSSPLWDRLFATHLTAEHVRIPLHLAPPWLLDTQGEVRAEWRRDYELARRAEVIR